MTNPPVRYHPELYPSFSMSYLVTIFDERAILGTEVGMFTLPLQEPMLLPPRRITLVHAIAASLVISGCIIRYYVLPLRVAMEAAFYLHEKEHGVILKRLSKSDDPVAQDAAELLQRAEGE